MEHGNSEQNESFGRGSRDAAARLDGEANVIRDKVIDALESRGRIVASALREHRKPIATGLILTGIGASALLIWRSARRRLRRPSRVAQLAGIGAATLAALAARRAVVSLLVRRGI